MRFFHWIRYGIFKKYKYRKYWSFNKDRNIIEIIMADDPNISIMDMLKEAVDATYIIHDIPVLINTKYIIQLNAYAKETEAYRTNKQIAKMAIRILVRNIILERIKNLTGATYIDSLLSDYMLKHIKLVE